MEKEYLGDGVYVSIDQFGQVWLETQRENGRHYIALEPVVFRALLNYVERREAAIKART